MSGNNYSDIIRIKSSSAANGITTIVIGLAFLLSGTLIMSFAPELFFLVGVLFVSASIIAFVMGFFKLKEPKVSLSISPDSLVYHHRRGEWKIEWDNIQRFDIPKINKGLEQIELEMIGIRLKEPEKFLQSISPRLVTHLLMEQRPLVTQADQSQCVSGRCYGDDLIEDQKYKCRDGILLTGVSAMLANRMKRLQMGLGYDIFISVNELDRSPREFITLLHECRESVQERRMSSEQP